MDFPLLNYLNPLQQKAVTAGDGHLCINAAAGTGKTSTIAARILYLQLMRGVSPRSILAVSFSRAARMELIRRLEAYINLVGRGSAVTILTFHGLAFRVLRTAIHYGETWLRPGFRVVTAGRGRLNPLFEEHGAWLVRNLRDDYDPETRLVLYAKALDMVRQGHSELDGVAWHPDQLDDVKADAITVRWDHGACSRISLGQLQTVWKRYNELLKRYNCIDYPGMLAECLEILWSEGATLEDFQKGLRYLIVDEYQDTSRAQELMMRLLAGEKVSLNVVGDSDQAIYTFNGSDPQNILKFSERMAGCTLPVLPSIDLTWNYRSTPNILAAANRVLVAAAHRPGKLEPAPYGVSEVVDLYRRRNLPVIRVHARKLEDAARWVAREIQRLITDESVKPHEIAVLVRKDTTHSPQGAMVRQALADLGLNAQVQDRDPERTAQVLDVVHALLVERFCEPLSKVIASIQAHECDVELDGITTEEALAVLEEARRSGATTAQEAADAIMEKGSPDPTDPEITGVQVRTIHSAKGLEFRVVFLMYLGDREFPSGERHDLAEERRLLYVGVTRAMERLYVVGRRGVAFPSFFDEIAGHGVKLVEASPVDEIDHSRAVDLEFLRQVEEARRLQREQQTSRRKSR